MRTPRESKGGRTELALVLAYLEQAAEAYASAALASRSDAGDHAGLLADILAGQAQKHETMAECHRAIIRALAGHRHRRPPA